MSLTLGNWLSVGFCILLTIIITGVILLTSDGDAKVGALINFIVGFVISVSILIGLNWYNTSTASGVRNYKDWQSELNNGIYREITITAEDGRVIFHYEGKVDIESNHEDNYIKFESEDGKRYIIYYGITDTILIIEK